MRQGEPSRTAEHMALFRALETVRRPAIRCISDPFARAFLDARLRAVVTLGALPGVVDLVCGYIDRRWPGARTSAIARTRFIDEQANAAVAAGVEQIVLLGAGFDSRPYRLRGWDRIAVFEVDHPDTQARKRRLLGDTPSRVRFVPVDFDRQSVEAALEAAGYDRNRNTLFIWEGVTNYLTESAVDATLRWCSRAASSSRIVFTYVHRGVLDDPASFFGTARLFDTLDASGERWTFGLDPAGLASFLAARGFHLDEDVGAEEYRRRCFGTSATAMRGYEFYHIACAHVTAGTESPTPVLTRGR
jgi:methyltransferase (TIGR00027 family)